MAAKKPARELPDQGIGFLADGKPNVVSKDAPPFKPKIVDAEGNEVELGEDD